MKWGWLAILSWERRWLADDQPCLYIFISTALLDYCRPFSSCRTSKMRFREADMCFLSPMKPRPRSNKPGATARCSAPIPQALSSPPIDSCTWRCYLRTPASGSKTTTLDVFGDYRSLPLNRHMRPRGTGMDYHPTIRWYPRCCKSVSATQCLS